MTIRTINWAVGADCKTVTPAAIQEGGVQGEDNAARVVFDLTAATPLDETMTYYIECVDCMGGYDKTPPLALADGTITAPVPLAWTQHGGVITLRLVCGRQGQTVYTLEGRLRFAGRQTATRQVDSLLRTDIQQTLEAVEAAKLAAQTQAAQAAAHAATADAAAMDAGDAANEAAVYAGQAAASADTAGEAASIARQAAETAAGIEKRIAALAVPDDSTVRADGLWSSLGIVDRLCPPFAGAGNVVQAYPVAGYPLAVKTDVKNLLMPPSEMGDQNGLTITDNGDGSYTLGGTATAGTSWLFHPTDYEGWAVGDVLRLSGCPAGGGDSYKLIAESFSEYHYDIGEGVEFAVTDQMLTFGLYVLLSIAGDVTCNSLTFRPCLVKVADTPTTITRCGKNLLNLNGATGVSTLFRVEGEDLIVEPGKCYGVRWDGSFLKVGETYTFSLAEDPTNKGDYWGWFVNYTDGTATSPQQKRVLTITPTKSIQYIRFYIGYGEEFATETVLAMPQCQWGDTATAYEPYSGHSFPVEASGTTTVPAAAGCNTLYADRGTVTVTGRLDPVRMLLQRGDA